MKLKKGELKKIPHAINVINRSSESTTNKIEAMCKNIEEKSNILTSSLESFTCPMCYHKLKE